MRKRLIRAVESLSAVADVEWLDLERIAQVEVSSEDGANPIESALIPNADGEWCAAEAGEQTIRLIFDTPQSIHRIHVVIDERERSRTQEFVLRWSESISGPLREICRQQWNFSPPETKREVEEYQVELSNVTVLELIVVPNMSGGTARASLKSLRLY